MKPIKESYLLLLIVLGLVSLGIYTTYAYGINENNQVAYNRGRLGDATGEVVLSDQETWYSGYARFPYSDSPWFYRGGTVNGASSVGVFYFENTSARTQTTIYSYSTRAILVSLR